MHQDATWYGGRPQPRGLCARWGPSSPSPKRGHSPQIFGRCLLWPNGWMDQYATWYEGRPQPRPLCWMGTQPLPTKEVEPPLQFSAHFYCGQTAGYIKMSLGMEVGLSPGDFVSDGDLPKRRRSPQFMAHVYCGQTAGWIKMTLGIEVGLGPVHIVLDGDTAPLPKRAETPNFHPIFIVPKGLDASRCHLVWR